MTTKRKINVAQDAADGPIKVSFVDVLTALKGNSALSETRLRDLRSAVKRVAFLLGDDPARIPLDLPTISAKLAAVNPVAAGLISKTFSNIRSDFMAAVKVSGLKPVQRSTRVPLSPAWTKLIADLSTRRAHIGLSRLARYASAKGIEPEEINDATIDGFITAVRDGSLHRKPNDLHRMVALIWNEAARRSGFDLMPVEVPSFRRPTKRIEWTLLANAFRKDVDKYLTWCGGSDAFADNARSRALGPRTLKLRRDQIHAAVTALAESGIKPSAIKSLAGLVSPEAFKRILRRRIDALGGRENTFNRDLAELLVQIAREWARVDAGVLTELQRLVRKVPMPASGLTDKNKRFLRQFDDPAALHRLYLLPGRLWAEVKRDGTPNFRTLAKAQVALAVAVLSYMPLRLRNLTALTFGIHLFIREEARAISTLELSAGEVKNKTELAFDIPPHVAKMLIDYRDRIAPKVIGHRPERLFVNADGSPKSQATVAWLITTYVKRRAGVVLTAHQFRHLSAKVMLDAEPGNFESVRQMLGHKNYKTTVGAYAGIDSRRAGRHHQRLVEQALAEQKPIRTRRQQAPSPNRKKENH
jgi:integrase